MSSFFYYIPGAIICLIVAMVAGPNLIAPDKRDDMAHQARVVVQAGGHYIRDNHDALLAQVKDGRTVMINTPKLQEYLPADFVADNPWHQHYQLNIIGDPKKPSGLTAFVLTTGGQPIASGDPAHPFTNGVSDINRIARQIPHGGYISFPSDIATADDDSWHIFLSDYGVKSPPGHLFVWVSDDLLPGGERRPDAVVQQDNNHGFFHCLLNSTSWPVNIFPLLRPQQ